MKYFLIIPALILALLGGCAPEDKERTEEPWFLFKKHLGNSIWSEGMIMNDEGDIYVRLSEDGNHLVKHDRHGNTLWKKSFASGFDRVNHMAVDGLDNICFTGRTRAEPAIEQRGGYDIFILKYGEGRQLFRKQWGTRGYDEEGYKAAVDSRNNIYIIAKLRVTRVSYIGEFHIEYPGSALFLYKFDSRGVLEWEKRVMEEDYEYHEFLGKLAVDSRDNVYIAEKSPDSGVLLLKYDGDGVLLWERQLEALGADAVKIMIADGEGNVYIIGDTSKYLAGARKGGRDIFWFKYDSEGNTVGKSQWGTSDDDKAVSAAFDGRGNLHIAGRIDEGWSGSGRPREILILKRGADGSLAGERRHGNREQHHTPHDMVIGKDNSIYLAAYVNRQGFYGSYYLFKLKPM